MSYANRGKTLEDIIELSNMQYKAKGIAVIDKIPTPVKVLKTYPNGKIYGFWEKKSTVDFGGVLQGGKAVYFDAKETKGKNLPFANIHQHQLDHMIHVYKMGGIAFLVVYFSDSEVFYRLGIKSIIEYIKSPYKSNKKSIPIKYFEEYGQRIGKSRVLLDYLKGLI